MRLLEPPLGPKEDREHTSITEFGYGAGETHWLAADTFADCCEKDEQEMERDVFRHSLVQRDEDGRECVVVTWTCLNCLEELDDGGAWRQLEYEDGQGATPLFVAAHEGHRQIVQTFLRRGAQAVR